MPAPGRRVPVKPRFPPWRGWSRWTDRRPRVRRRSWLQYSCSLQVTLETIEAGFPEKAIALEPPSDALQWNRIDLVHTLATDAPLAHQPRVPQHSEMP